MYDTVKVVWWCDTLIVIKQKAGYCRTKVVTYSLYHIGLLLNNQYNKPIVKQHNLIHDYKMHLYSVCDVMLTFIYFVLPNNHTYALKKADCFMTKFQPTSCLIRCYWFGTHQTLTEVLKTVFITKSVFSKVQNVIPQQKTQENIIQLIRFLLKFLFTFFKYQYILNQFR